MYGGRRRYRDYEARGRSLDSPGLSSLLSEAQDSSLDSASLSLVSSSLVSTTASSSSTRDRVLQGRWRTMLEDPSRDRRHAHTWSPARRRSSWAVRSASPASRDRFSDRFSDRDRFSDGVRERSRFPVDMRDRYFESLRDRDRFSDSSVSTVLRAPPRPGYADSEAETLRSCDSRDTRSLVSSVSTAGSRCWSPPHTRRREDRGSPLARTRSFQSIRPESPEFPFPEPSSPSPSTADFSLEDYKSVSAQDFREGLLREERRARETDDEKLTSARLPADEPRSEAERFEARDNSHAGLRSHGRDQTGRLSPTVSLSESSLSSQQQRYAPAPSEPEAASLLPAHAQDEVGDKVESVEKILAMRQRLATSGGTNQEKLSQEVDDELMKLLRNSQAQNSRLKIELKALESMLESAKFQLASTKEKVAEDNIDYEKDKKEDEAVAKKLNEIEEELKILSFSENLTDQALGQLKVDNEKLRDERSSLLQVLYKLSRVI